MVIILSAIFFNSLALGNVVSIRSCFIRAETMFLSIAFRWADVRFKRRTCFPWCISNVEFQGRGVKKKLFVIKLMEISAITWTHSNFMARQLWVSVLVGRPVGIFFVKESPTMLARASIRKGLYHAQLGLTVTSCKSLCINNKAIGFDSFFPMG